MPVYKLSTPLDGSTAPAGALPLHDKQHLDMHGVELEVTERCVTAGRNLSHHVPSLGNTHPWPHARQHLPVALTIPHPAVRRHAAGLGIDHRCASGTLHDFVGDTSRSRPAAAVSAAGARRAHRSSAEAAEGRDTDDAHSTIHGSPQRKNFTGAHTAITYPPRLTRCCLRCSLLSTSCRLQAEAPCDCKRGT